MQAIEVTNASPGPKRLAWTSTAAKIAAGMTRMSLPELDEKKLEILAFQLESLAVGKRLNDGIGLLPPTKIFQKAHAVKKAAAKLRSLLGDDASGAALQIIKQAEARLEQSPTGCATDPDDIASRGLKLIDYQAPFARTEVFGNATFTPLAPLSNLRAHLSALEAAAQGEIDALRESQRGVREKEFRQLVIGRYLPDLYVEMYPSARKGTYNPVEGTLDGPLYRFVQLASDALGFGRPKPEAIQQAVRRERILPPPP